MPISPGRWLMANRYGCRGNLPTWASEAVKLRRWIHLLLNQCATFTRHLIYLSFTSSSPDFCFFFLISWYFIQFFLLLSLSLPLHVLPPYFIVHPSVSSLLSPPPLRLSGGHPSLLSCPPITPPLPLFFRPLSGIHLCCIRQDMPSANDREDRKEGGCGEWIVSELCIIMENCLKADLPLTVKKTKHASICIQSRNSTSFSPYRNITILYSYVLLDNCNGNLPSFNGNFL